MLYPSTCLFILFFFLPLSLSSLSPFPQYTLVSKPLTSTFLPYCQPISAWILRSLYKEMISDETDGEAARPGSFYGISLEPSPHLLSFLRSAGPSSSVCTLYLFISSLPSPSTQKDGEHYSILAPLLVEISLSFPT